MRRRNARRRGIAMADFVAGTLLFSATLVVFAALTRSKFELISVTRMRAMALSGAETELDRVRADGLDQRPFGAVQSDGFRRVYTFDPRAREDAPALPGSEGLVEVRGLRMEGGDPRRLYEARVTVRWGQGPESGRVSLSTVTTLPQGRFR